MKQRLRIYRFVVSVLGVLSALLALDAHVSDTINNFYFPNAPVRDSTLFIGGLTVLAVILAIEAVAVRIPKTLGWKQDVVRLQCESTMARRGACTPASGNPVWVPSEVLILEAKDRSNSVPEPSTGL